MPKERRVLEGPHPQTFLAERGLFWAALGSPLACALALGAQGALRSLAREARPRPRRRPRPHREDAPHGGR